MVESRSRRCQSRYNVRADLAYITSAPALALQALRAGDNYPIMPEQVLPIPTAPALDTLALEREIAQLIVKGLNLPMQPDEIDPEAPLYGEGLGLDSIDILEIALIVSKQYGIQLRADNQENTRIFRSLRQFAQYVAEQRVK
jgi:acyl carrier protein